MSDDNELARRMDYHRNESFIISHCRSWFNPICMSLCALCTMSSVTKISWKYIEVNFVNTSQVPKCTPNMFLDFLSWFNISDCANAQRTLYIALILFPLFCHALSLLTSWKYRAQLGWFDVAVTYAIVSNLEQISGQTHSLMSYISLTFYFRLVYFNQVASNVLLALVYVSNINTIIFGGKYNAWSLTSYFFIWSFLLFGIFGHQLLYRAEIRKWDYIHALLICRARSIKLKKFAEDLGSLHRSPEVAEFLCSNGECCDDIKSKANFTNPLGSDEPGERSLNKEASQEYPSQSFKVTESSEKLGANNTFASNPLNWLDLFIHLVGDKFIDKCLEMGVLIDFKALPAHCRPAIFPVSAAPSNSKEESVLDALDVQGKVESDKQRESSQLTYSNLKCKESIVIGIRFLQSTEINFADTPLSDRDLNVEAAMSEVLNILAQSHQVTFCRYFGRVWIGSLGFFKTHGSLAKNIREALKMCCEMVHVLMPFHCRIECSVTLGDVLCGFLDEQIIDLFGSEVRWVLDSLSKPPSEVQQSGVNVSFDIYEFLRNMRHANEHEAKVNLASRFAYDAEKNSSNADRDLHSAILDPLLAAAEPYVKDEILSTYAIRNPYAMCALSQSDIVAFRSSVQKALSAASSEHDPNVLQLDPGYNDFEAEITDADFEIMLHNPLGHTAKAHDLGEKAAPEKWLALIGYKQILQCFYQNTYETHGISVSDPILMSYSDEEWISMHEEMSTSIEAVVNAECYTNPISRLLNITNIAYNTGIDELTSTIKYKTVDGVRMGNEEEAIDVAGHPALAPMVGMNNNNEISFSYLQKPVFDESFSSVWMSNPSHLYSFDQATYQVAGFATIRDKWIKYLVAFARNKLSVLLPHFKKVLSCKILGSWWSKASLHNLSIEKRRSRMHVETSQRLQRTSEDVLVSIETVTSTTLTSSTTTTTKTRQVHNIVNESSSGWSWLTSTSKENKPIFSLCSSHEEVETEIKTVQKVPAKDGELFVAKYSSDGKLVTFTGLARLIARIFFLICPLVIFYARQNDLENDRFSTFRMGRQEPLVSVTLGYFLMHFPLPLLEDRYGKLIFLIGMSYRIVMSVKFPSVSVFDFGYKLADPFSVWSTPNMKDFNGEIGTAIFIYIFCFGDILWRRTSLQIIIESAFIWISYYSRSTLTPRTTEQILSRTYQCILMEIMFLTILHVLEINKSMTFNAIVEGKILPHAIAVHRKYLNRAKASKKLYLPAVINIPLASDGKANRLFNYKVYQTCAVVAIHMSAAEMLPGYIEPVYFGEFMGNIRKLMNEAITECGLIWISTCNGTTIALCCDEAIWSGHPKHSAKLKTESVSINSQQHSYLSNALVFVSTLSQKLNDFMFRNDCSLVWSVGLDHGSVTLGMSRHKYRHFDAIGPTRDFAVLLSHISDDRGGIFASQAFNSCARASHSYHANIVFHSKNVLLNGKMVSVLKAPIQFMGISLSDLEHTRVIGSGGYGSVHLAYDKNSNADYAVKVIPLHKFSSKAKVSAQAEFLCLQQISHPNVIALRFSVTAKNKFYLVMPCLRGGNLTQIVESLRPTLVNLISLFAELILGLQFIHSKGIAHCDIKPMNCLVGLDGHLKIADFGLSKKIDWNADTIASPKAVISKLLPLKRTTYAISYNVLIITANEEDSVLKKMLKNPNYACATANTMEKCLSYMYAIGKPDLLIVEVQLPELEEVKQGIQLSEEGSYSACTAQTLECSGVITQNVQSFLGLLNKIFGKNCTPKISYDSNNEACVAENALGNFFGDNERAHMNTAADFGNPEPKGPSEDLQCAADAKPETQITFGMPILVTLPVADEKLKNYFDLTGKVRALVEIKFIQNDNLNLISSLAREGRSISLSEVKFCDEGSTQVSSPSITLSQTYTFSQASITRSEVVTVHNPSSAQFNSITVDKIHSSRRQSAEHRKHRLAGTIYYLAPETIEYREYNYSADWWSAGVSMCECVTGSKLFSAATKREIMRRILSPVSLKMLSDASFKQLAECDSSNVHRSCLQAMIATADEGGATQSSPVASVKSSSGSLPSDQDLTSKFEDLIKGLLQRNRSLRLGTRGASDIRVHPFFATINWDTVSITTPPFQPPQHSSFSKWQASTL